MNITLIVIVYVVAVFIILNPWSWNSLRTRAKKHLTSDPYRAISLACDAECCQQMVVMDGRRFLVDEAPLTPLQQCLEGSCGCRYIHHADRRSGSDRRVVRRDPEAGAEAERRGLRGRRKSDWSLLAISG